MTRSFERVSIIIVYCIVYSGFFLAVHFFMHPVQYVEPCARILDLPLQHQGYVTFKLD